MNSTNSHISDQELQRLFKELLLNDDFENNQKTIDMQAKIVFQSGCYALPVSGIREQQLLSKLKAKWIGKAFLKWTFFSLLTTGTVVTLVSINGNSDKKSGTVDSQQHPQSKTEIPLSPILPHDDQNPGLQHTAQEQEPQKTEEEQAYLPGKHSFSGIVSLPFLKMPLPELKQVIRNELSVLAGIDSTFSGVKELELNLDMTNVTFNASDKDLMEVGFEASDAENEANKIKLEISYKREGSLLKITVKDSDKRKKNITTRGIHLAELRISLPKNIGIKLTNNMGNADLNGITNDACKLLLGYGNVNLREVSSNIDLNMSSGNTSVKDLKGNFQFVSSYGNIDLTNVSGNVAATSSSGNLNLAFVKGNTSIESSYGKIELSNLKGNLTVNSSSGNIDIEKQEGEFLTINSSYGNISLKSVQARQTVNSSSGKVSFEQTKGNCKLNSSYGNVSVIDHEGTFSGSVDSGKITASGINGDVDLNAGYGNIALDEVKGKLKLNVSSGSISGKGLHVENSLSAKSDYGNIELSLKNPVTELKIDLSSENGKAKIDKEGVSKSVEDKTLLYGEGPISIKARSSSGNVIVN